MAHIGGAAAARDERPLLDDGIESTPTTQKGRSDVVVLKGWRIIFFYLPAPPRLTSRRHLHL
jgi:hypothetical protein